MSPAHKFDIRTIEVAGTRLTAHCYKGLGAFRVDAYAPALSHGKELWGVMLLFNKTLFPSIPVFRNIDDVSGFIWDVSTLMMWEQFTAQQFKRILIPLTQMLSHYNAYPLEPLLNKLTTTEEKLRLSVPMPTETIQ